MANDGVLGADPAVRISAGGTNRPADGELLRAGRESASATRVAEVGSTGVPAFEPLVLATTDGETAFFDRCSAGEAGSIVETLESGSLPTEGAMAVVEHERGTERLPTPSDGPLGVGDRRVLRSCGWTAPTSLADHRAADAFVAGDEGSDDAISRVADAGLRGRGRGDAAADVPIADRWTVAEETEGEGVVVVNANEADPRATTDRLLLESAPLAVLDAALAAAGALGAMNVLVYCNEADTLAQERAAAAASALEEELTEGAPIEVLSGPDEYKAGETTMAIEALEGNHRLEARLRPPYPSEEGLDGRPTLVHTPRTLAQVGEVLGSGDRNGSSGSDPSSGPDSGSRLFSVTGDVPAAATVELTAAADLSAVREAVAFDDRLKAACVGGVFGGLTRTLDVPARANALSAAGLGTNGVIELFGDERCMVSFAGNRAVFGEEENCGRCVPCREGTKQLTGMLRDVYGGEYASEGIRELLRVMGNTSICSFGEHAPRPVRTAIDEFEVEFRAHANGRCPAGVCK
jgi:NADH-quinone oxidoreductase subunit F